MNGKKGFRAFLLLRLNVYFAKLGMSGKANFARIFVKRSKRYGRTLNLIFYDAAERNRNSRRKKLIKRRPPPASPSLGSYGTKSKGRELEWSGEVPRGRRKAKTKKLKIEIAKRPSEK